MISIYDLIYLIKRALISNHTVVDLKDLKVIDKNYHGNKYKRKISEDLYIKQHRPAECKEASVIWNFLTEQLILISVTENVIKIF